MLDPCCFGARCSIVALLYIVLERCFLYDVMYVRCCMSIGTLICVNLCRSVVVCYVGAWLCVMWERCCVLCRSVVAVKRRSV